MPKIAYRAVEMGPKRLAVVAKANEIIDEYAAQGFDLTLRQLYYQFVARGLVENKQQEYKRLGDIVNDARLAGLIDWDHITDRTRNVRSLAHWESPSDIVAGAAQQFRLDKWKEQEHRIEVWIEKDALVGVIAGVCHELDLPYFSCRGYTSQSEMWAAAQRLLHHRKAGQRPVILHFGDHDPSGIDMSRDIQDRLEMFMRSPTRLAHAAPLIFERLALNMPQVEKYNPPPNPAKTTDSRYEGYIRLHGDESWELDALEPAVIAQLIRSTVARYRDQDAWDEAKERENDLRAVLTAASNRWNDVAAFLSTEEAE